MDTKGGKPRGGAVMNWAIGIDMYTLMCIKLMTNKNLPKKQKQKQTIDDKGEKKKFIKFLIKEMEMINLKNFCSCISSKLM